MFNWIKTAKKIFTGEDHDRALVHINDDGFMSNDIAVSIEDIISDEKNEDIGKIHILSLTEFHEAMGETWDAREDKIFLLTESVLRRMIGEGNRWEHQSKEIYIMLFPRLIEIEADARAYEIAEELGLKIIGERFDGTRRPMVRVAGVDPKDALNADGTLNIEKLEQVGRKGQSAGNGKAINAGQDELHQTGEKGPDWQKRAHEHDDVNTDWKNNPNARQDKDGNWHVIEHQSGEHDTNWKERHHKAGPALTPKWQEMERDEKKTDDGPKWVSMETKKASSPNQIPSQSAKPKSKYSLSFAPCWDKETESLHIYKSVLNFDAGDGERLEGQSAYHGHKTPEQRFIIDLWVMQNTVKALFPLVSKKMNTPVFIPVHSSSIRDDNRERFFEGLSKFKPDLRKNYIIIEIIDDGEWDKDDFIQVTTQLSELVQAIALQPSAKHDFTAPLNSNINWVGLDLSTLDAATGISPKRLIALHQEAGAIKAKTYVFGLTKRLQIAEMLDLGIELISGAALVKNTEKLRPPFNLPIERLKK